MGELVAALADILGVHLLHGLGRLGVFFFTFGTYTCEPYHGEADDAKVNTHRLESQPAATKVVSKGKTMLLGFAILVVIVVLIGIKAAPYVVG